MKLWQKVFLWSLILVTLSVAALAALLAQNTHRQNLRREERLAIQEHGLLVTAVQSALIYDRTAGDGVLYSARTASSFAEHVETYLSARSDLSVELFSGSSLLYSSPGAHHLLTETRPETEVEAGKALVLYRGTSLYVAAKAVLEGTEYTVVTCRDVGILFEQRRHQLNEIATYGIVIAAGVTLAMLIVTRGVLNPLTRLERAADRVAGGDYTVRLPVRGNSETANLSEAFNTMAEAVQANVAELEAIAEDRKRFTDNLAHEMKTPLTSIIGYADLLRSARKIDDEQRFEYADIIYQEGKHLKTFSGKLMELILVGKTAADLQPIELTEFLEEVVRLTTPAVVQRGLTLILEIRSRMTIRGDRALLQSLLFNRIDNSAKASPAGKTIELSARRDRRGRIHISVSDHGRGMPPEETRKVTQAFYMLDKARTRAEGGAGLGLALCAEIAKCHNAQLTIQSQVNVGTTVDVAFPREAEA